jgi:hypothetical protein
VLCSLPAAIADELAAVSVVVQAWPLRWAAAQAKLQLQEQRGSNAAQKQAGAGGKPAAGGFWITDPGERSSPVLSAYDAVIVCWLMNRAFLCAKS